MAANVNDTLDNLMQVDGMMMVALVDAESGMVLGKAGSGLDVELAAAGNSQVVKAKLSIMKSLGIKGGIEDILITLEKQYHIIRPTDVQEGLFYYAVLDRNRGNLAMARVAVRNVERTLRLAA